MSFMRNYFASPWDLLCRGTCSFLNAVLTALFSRTKQYYVTLIRYYCHDVILIMGVRLTSHRTAAAFTGLLSVSGCMNE
jgi:hypothetical protein